MRAGRARMGLKKTSWNKRASSDYHPAKADFLELPASGQLEPADKGTEGLAIAGPVSGHQSGGERLDTLQSLYVDLVVGVPHTAAVVQVW